MEQIEKQLADKATQGDVFAYIKHEDSPKGALQAAFSAGEVEGAVRDTSELLAEAASGFAAAAEFLPRRFLRNGHLQTLVGNFLPRQYVLPEPEAHIIQVDAGEGDAAYGIPGRPTRGQSTG